MTTESDLSSGTSGNTPKPGDQSPSQTSRSAEIRMNMPDRKSGSPDDGEPSASGQSQASIERLLLKLMGRLDENDRHYGRALDKLNERLNDLSQRAQSASASSPAGTTAALERVHEQASSLAVQVNDAGTARRAQQTTPMSEVEHRLRTFSNPLEGAPPPGTNSAVNDDFADVTQRLERSLAADAPASEFDTLANRMDDLARHLDAALESRNDHGTLQSIEARLDALARCFANAQQHYARIEDIEGHLLSLINWTQSANAPANDRNMSARLDSIEHALQALNDNARALDDRADATLEALNEAMDSPSPRAGSSPRPGTARNEFHIDDVETEFPHTAGEPNDTGEYAEVWINESQKVASEPAPRASRPGAAPAYDELGSGIPDYQTQPATSREKQLPERRGGKADRRAQSQDRVEPAVETDNDFIASARRAAAAAAAQIPEPGTARSRTGPARQFPNKAAESAPARSKRPRPFFIVAAAGLLLISAGILFGQLKNKPEATSASPVGQAAPPPARAPKAPAPANKQQSSLPEADTGSEKLHSGRLAPRQKQPASAKSAAPPATSPTASATRANYRPSPPARDSLPPLQPQQPVSTATLLASMPPEAAGSPLPGVQVTIKERSEHTPAPRARTPSASAAPALVPPPASASRPDPLALPKRAPTPGTPTDSSNIASRSVDSAPARRVPQPIPSRGTAMPPVRIGPQSLRVAAAHGNPSAQVEVASRFAKGTGVAKNLKKAAEWYDRAAAQGFAPAQYRLAALHERGLGVKKDLGLARTWYRRAAELGNIRAMHNLAVLHTRSKPNSPDYTKAKNWFHEAARHGLADSQFNLGVLYESGLGVRKNAAEAYKWYTLAARQGDDEARKRREAIRLKLPARSLRAVEQTIRRWKSATPKEAANRTGQPRGGWHNAAPPTATIATSQALVARAQKLLNKLGYSAGVPDGKLGPQTVSAIRRFEIRTGVPESGQVTRKLLQQLGALSS